MGVFVFVPARETVAVAIDCWRRRQRAVAGIGRRRGVESVWR